MSTGIFFDPSHLSASHKHRISHLFDFRGDTVLISTTAALMMKIVSEREHTKFLLLHTRIDRTGILYSEDVINSEYKIIRE